VDIADLPLRRTHADEPGFEVRKVGLDLRLHDCRHTTATLLLSQGVQPHVVSGWLGHSGITITLGTYGHVLKGAHDDAAARLGELRYRDQPSD
jgi:integrase